MVEFIHRNYLEKSYPFKNIYSVQKEEDSKNYLEGKEIDLVLLDIHLKEGNGLNLLKKIRESYPQIEVIMVTAANEKNVISEALHLGVLDYLVKPFTFERFKESIVRFLKLKETWQNETFDQKSIDELIGNGTNQALPLEKGMTEETLNYILKELDSYQKTFTVISVAEKTGLSQVSIRKYLRYLEDRGQIKSAMQYEKKGRPYKVYEKV